MKFYVTSKETGEIADGRFFLGQDGILYRFDEMTGELVRYEDGYVFVCYLLEG
jgi:hypothetical protein